MKTTPERCASCVATLTLALAACTGAQRSGDEPNEPCAEQRELEAAAAIVDSTPLGAIALVEEIDDCDDKFALLYLAERQIASRSGEEYYYNGVANPRGFYDRDPNRWEAYVLEHLEHFVSAREGSGIEAGRLHLDRIVDRSMQPSVWRSTTSCGASTTRSGKTATDRPIVSGSSTATRNGSLTGPGIRRPSG